MSLNFNNGVANIRQTPGIISNTSANKPGAADVATGTLYISTDTGTIERSDGATWVSLGGGSTADLQTVLNTGNISNNVGFTIVDTINNDYFRLDTTTFGIPTITFFNFLSNANLDINYGALNFYNNFANKGLYINIDSLQSQDLTTNYYTKINYSSTIINTEYQNGGGSLIEGIILNFSNKSYQLGSINGNINYIQVSEQYNYIELTTGLAGGNSTTLRIDDNLSYIKTSYLGNGIGISLEFANNIFYLGDYDNNINGTVLAVDDANQKLILSNNLKSATAGGSSGQHLKIRVGSTDYKIQLLNP